MSSSAPHAPSPRIERTASAASDTEDGAGSRLGLDPERLEHVSHGRQGSGALAQQVVRARRETARDLPGDGEDVAPELEREIGRDQGTGPLARLHDHRRQREGGDDPVTSREPPGCRLDPGRILGDDCARRDDPPGQLRVAARVVPVDPASEHSHRPSAALQGASVSLAVHASRQPAHDDEPGRRQLAGERPRHLGAVRGARARADDGDSGLRQRAAVPADEEVRRRIVQLREQGRIAGLAPGNSPNRVHAHEPSSVGDR